MKIKNVILVMFLVLLLAGQNVYAQKKLAQTGFQFLSVVPDARAAALGDAMTTVSNHSGALWSNPAMLAEMTTKIDVVFNQNNWIADINHNAFSLAYRPSNGQYGVFGISFLYVDYGEVEGTIVANNEQGFLDTGIIEPYAYSMGISYAKALSNKFSVGGNVKWANQYLGPALQNLSDETGAVKTFEAEETVMVFDFGTNFKTGLKSLAFGMSVRNFSEEIKFSQENFQLPLTFSIGFSANLVDFMPESFQSKFFNNLLVSIDAVHPRSHPEYFKFGSEYILMDLLALRLGYMAGTDEANLTYGFGINKFGFGVDYAYVPYGVFDNVQRFTLRFAL